MAYPFVQMPTLGEFITRVKSEYKGEVITPNGVLTGPRGQADVRLIVRIAEGGKKRIAVIPNLNENDVLVPHVLRSLCVQLGISLKDFGLVLG